MCDLRQQRRAASLDCNVRIELVLRNAVNRQQLPANLDTARGAISMHAYINGILYQWLLAPDSFQLHIDAERWVDTGLDMLRLSPSLRN
jgi:TetR/AcrR family acrAB operon transcriptional repressor